MPSKILVAEDDKFLMKVYQSKLGKEGFQVIPAMDGDEAVRFATEKHPDLMLLDLIMPKKNGFTALAEMKQDKLLKNVPVIILSNLGQDDDIKRGLSLGAAGYLVKAEHSLEEVVQLVRETLARK
ncbi:MAG: Alkaline phosphatase synthesis transcriptional regulatory protein PhoP, two-component system, OmpR [Candidatus Magasanikbacteria bacterium]|nr:Alkaline phosphatase synthesis transcriptional regulatory protein PhoP, two-component system, OmpR [Candidatus Magasanikbacteria bacterium]